MNTPYVIERRIRHNNARIKLRTPYSVRHKLANDTSGHGHHEKLAEIVTNTELTFLVISLFLTESYGDDMLVKDIVRQRIREVLDKYCEAQDV